MEISSIWMSQRILRRKDQIPRMISNLDCLPKIELIQCEDGEVQVHEGHHRLVANWLAGQRKLEKHQYILLQQDNYRRARFGKIEDMIMECDYCGDPGVKVDCLSHTCCEACWEHMKDWTLEKQAELDILSKEVCAWDNSERPKILEENGLPPDAKDSICFGCRKLIQSDDHGNWYCECHDERKGIDPNHPNVVLIPNRFFKNVG